MTKDPVGIVINALREVYDDRLEITIWSDSSPAKIVLVLPPDHDPATLKFLSAVITEKFSTGMMLEFEKGELTGDGQW